MKLRAPSMTRLIYLAVTSIVLSITLESAEAAEAAAVAADAAVSQWTMIAAAVASGLSTLAAGYAVATVGSAAVGALAEKPELFGRVLIVVGLAEGVAIYGLIVAVLILNRAG